MYIFGETVRSYYACNLKELSWGHERKQRNLPTVACNVGKSVLIAMNLNLNVSCHLLNVYTTFQIDKSKPVEKVRKTSLQLNTVVFQTGV